MFLPVFLYLYCAWIPNYAVGNVADITGCSFNCSKEVEIGFNRGGTQNFNLCMETCVTKKGKPWPLLINSSTCGKTGKTSGSKQVCAAKSVSAHYVYRTHKTDSSSETREYLLVYWEPCAIASEHLQGYMISLQNYELSGYHSDCIQIALSRNLTQEDMDDEFAALFSQFRLDYNTDYRVTVHGLPLQDDNIATDFIFKSSPCPSLNGFGSCHCGLPSYRPVPNPNISVNGYCVTVSITPLPSCFEIRKYELYIFLNTTNQVIMKFEQDFMGDEILTARFCPLYPPRNIPKAHFAVKYRALDFNHEHADSRSVRLNIIDWIPSRPTLQISKYGLKVTFRCTPTNYGINKYQVKLFHNESQVKLLTVNAYCSDQGNFTALIKSLDPGVYSSQVREWRNSSYNAAAMWSPLSNTVKSDNVNSLDDGGATNSVAILISAIAVFSVVASLVTAVLCCRHRNFCIKVQRLPESLRLTIHAQPDHTHICRTVWVVWQTDYKNSHASDVHAENVRHLASFLANQCGLNIILDQYEATSAPSLSLWLQEKQKAADTVLFVCPHQAISKSDCSIDQLMGNFLSVYNLYESALLFENLTVKFASVVLPYSQPAVYKEANLLLQRIPSFQLMDDIESLYFFIQSRGKAGPYGRCHLENVNKHDYSKTAEGAKLKEGFLRMQLVLIDDSSGLLPSGESLVIEDVQERDIVVNDIADREADLEFSDKFEPLPPPPIQPEEDADNTLYLINTSDLLSQQPIDSECVEAVTFDSNCPLLQSSPVGTTVMI